MEKARARNVELKEQLKQLQKVCEFCQQEKAALLQQRAELQESAALREPLQPDVPAATQEMYNSVLESVCQFGLQELKVLELKEHLQLVKVTEERDRINHALSQVGQDRSQVEESTSSALDRWHREMDTVMDREALQKSDNSNKDFRLALDKLFFNVTFKGVTGEGQQLSFSTRHGGICVHISVKEPVKQPNSCQDASSTDTMYLIQSDMYVADLAGEGNRYLKSGLSATDFVRNIVWKHIKEDCLALS